MGRVEIEILVGENSIGYIETVSKLRIDIFREYPYLYEGDLNYEQQYVKGYTMDKKAMIALARIDGKIAGVSTGIPLISDSEIVVDAKKVFSKDNIDIGDYYYYGEVIVLPEYRGKGITTQLYDAQHELVKEWGYKHVCILTVVREESHPLKPITYRSPDKMWEHLGFFRNNLTVDYHWPTIHADKSVKDVSNKLEFWTKDLFPSLEAEDAVSVDKKQSASI